jgi:cystathionine beta-synthase
VASLKLRNPMTVSPDVSCHEALKIMNKEGYDQLPVVDDKGCV